MSNSLTVVPFLFGSQEIRTLIDPDGIHLWVAKDVANALGSSLTLILKISANFCVTC